MRQFSNHNDESRIIDIDIDTDTDMFILKMLFSLSGHGKYAVELKEIQNKFVEAI